MNTDALAFLPTGHIVPIDPAVIDVARRAMSASSWRALRADVRVFAEWAAAHGVTILPAAPASVAAFLRDQAEAGRRAATLARYTSSIARLHALADQPDPTRAELVRLELKAQRRALGVRQKQARGLHFRGEVADPLAAVGPVGVCVEAMLAASSDDVPGHRDRALLSLAFDTGLRRSEIVAARWPHVERSSSGGRLFVPRSKADQEGVGAYAFLSARTMAALDSWAQVAGGREGAVFRRLHRSDTKVDSKRWPFGPIGDADLSRDAGPGARCPVADDDGAGGIRRLARRADRSLDARRPGPGSVRHWAGSGGNHPGAAVEKPRPARPLCPGIERRGQCGGEIRRKIIVFTRIPQSLLANVKINIAFIIKPLLSPGKEEAD